MKPKIVEKIEALWGGNFELKEAPAQPTKLGGLMAFKKDMPKYALDEKGQLIGLNLAATGLDDVKWEKIRELLEKENVKLQALNLSDNQIKNLLLPPGVLAMQLFDVESNPIENLPKQTIEQGNAAILNFFQQIEEQEGTVPLYEAKLLIVGEPGAGKTTLLEKLKDPEYLVPLDGDKAIKSTVGVNIFEGYNFTFPNDPDIEFKANLWDFGGQEIQYMTHHFFLTPRALYVLVADDRKQNTEFDYWFRIINLLGRESEEEKISVLVVLNEINHLSVSNFSLAKYRQDYPGMDIQMWEVDFSVKDRRSDNLSEKIQEMLCGLPQIGDQLPRLWVPIREDLLKMRKEKPHITFTEFAKVCGKERNGKRLNKEKDQRFLSSYLHRLGVMLHYQEDDFLDNFVILNPQWAVDAVYSVLKDSRVVKKHGRFTLEDLKDFWKDYTSDERSRLFSLMLKDRFEICYPSTKEGEYIAPQLLPNEYPKFEWDSANAMKFRYQYPFMPKGLISRLIVRLSEYIAEKGKLVWNEGVVIERNGCRAKIVQEKTVKEGLEVLEIEISGATYERKYLLHQVMTEVEKIHEKSFKHIDFERMIPCICDVCKGADQPTFFEYSELIQYQEESWSDIDCRNGKLKKVSVDSLLEGVFKKVEGLESGTNYYMKLGLIGEDIKGLKDGLEHIKGDTQAILFNQNEQQKYLDTLLIYAEKHRANLELLFERVDEIPGNAKEDLDRVNALLEEQLNKCFAQLPAGTPIVQEWKKAKEEMPHIPDSKWKFKLKIPFVFGEFEKELSWDTKAALKLIRKEISAFRKGEKTLKQLFVEEDDE